jgi:hypothetical protein
MDNYLDTAVIIQTGTDFLKEGLIIVNKDDRGLTGIQFGINDRQLLGDHMFVFKNDLVESTSFADVKKGSIKYFIWDSKIYEVEILFIIKPNPDRYDGEDNEFRFIGKSYPDFFGSKFISDEPVTDLFNTREEAQNRIDLGKITALEEEIKRTNKELEKLKKKVKNKSTD